MEDLSFDPTDLIQVETMHQMLETYPEIVKSEGELNLPWIIDHYGVDVACALFATKSYIDTYGCLPELNPQDVL
jgi:hypothetical protein